MSRLKLSLGLNVRDTPGQLVRKGRLAEEVGLDGVWVSDLPSERYAPAMAAVLAGETEKVRIGVGPLSPILHPVEHIAKSIRTLIDLFGDRFDLLIAAGDRERLKAVGVEYPPSLPSRMVRALRQIRSRLGRYNTVCRILLGAQGPQMLKASRKFDGVLINFSDTEMLRWAIEKARPSSRSFEVGIFAPAYIHSRLNPRIREMALSAATIVAAGAPPAVARRFRLFPSSGDIVTRFCIIKKVEEFRRYLSELEGLGIEQAVLSFPQGYSVRTIRDLAGVK
ncbi:MAG: LLM class flavin-dependent oxidoreductase [Candidatus Bathyarchaeia archaeon]